MLTALDRPLLADTLAELGADGWLLYDFRGVNPVAGRVVGAGGLGSRRLFVWLPREGTPVAVAHRIELQPLRDFPGRVVPYARWEELHAALGAIVARRTVAMEVSAEDAVPYLDRVPAGVVELVRRLGGTVVPSGALVTTFAARWTSAEADGHRRAAAALAEVAQAALRDAVGRGGTGYRECALQGRVVDELTARGLVLDHAPIVAFGPTSADPHYQPEPGHDRELAADDVVLLDLFAGEAPGAVQADQTWMAFSGATPPADVIAVWEAVRDAREAAIALMQARVAAAAPVRGFELDRAARAVLEGRGFGGAVLHRTGHSIDQSLHGSGPHLDDFETHDDRLLVPGVGFSVEPGVYLAGRFGMRSEVNMYWGPSGAEVTPPGRQETLILRA
ncbi:MAG: M24 family metallopeptidase [Gemmatimonadales bacterium]|nr:M24 family metallopeptidase [Gemmatimonadales bacterium]